MSPKEIFWCGEGDLNPHEISPASTSSNFSLYRPVPWCADSTTCSSHHIPLGPAISHLIVTVIVTVSEDLRRVFLRWLGAVSSHSRTLHWQVLHPNHPC
jgi:hypothetical protein